ncbi:hypothetical protein BJX76DRAFT_364177 [Aspergillus varians]
MYDIALFGATGYTGKLCAAFIAQNYPTNVRWCVVGRSETRLKELRETLQSEYPDRAQPELEIVADLNLESIEPLVGRTKVVVNGVGPFHKFSTPIVEACANLGTHYLDFTTETLWIQELIDKYEDVAKRSGAIIIPAVSPTAPADIIAWLITRQIRDAFATGPTEIVSTGKLDIKAMSTGSLTTVLDSLATWGPSWYLSGNTWILTNKTNPPNPSTSLLTRLLGYRSVPTLGLVTTSFTGPGNASIVHRTATQNPDLYGPAFHYNEYLPAQGAGSALLIHLITKLAIVLLSVPLIRWLLRRSVDPGKSVPDQDELRRLERAEYRAVGMAHDTRKREGDKPVPVVRASFLREGALYEFTALLTCVAARVLLREREGLEKEERAGRGGFFTPSWLGMEYVEGLREVGVQIEMDGVDST